MVAVPKEPQVLPGITAAAYPNTVWRVAVGVIGVPSGASNRDAITTDHVASDAAFRAKPEVVDFTAFLTELATDAGAEAITEAGKELDYDLTRWGQNLAAAELAAHVYVAAFTGDDRAGAVILCARSRYLEHARARARVEFRAKEVRPLGGDLPTRLGAFADALKVHFLTENFGNTADIEHFFENGFLRVYVGRGGRYAKPLAINDKVGRGRYFAEFRPAQCDQLVFDTSDGILRVAANPARLAPRYAQIFGKALFDDELLFGAEPTCTLENLKNGTESLKPPVTLPIENVTLVKAVLHDDDARIETKTFPKRFFERFPDARLVDITLRLAFRDRTDVNVRIRPPDRVEYVHERHADDIERYLRAAGFRRRPATVQRDLWHLPTGVAPLSMAHAVFERGIKRLIDDEVLVKAPLDAIDGGSSGPLKVIATSAVNEFYAVPLNDDGNARALSPSNLDGVRLMPEAFAAKLAAGLECTGGTGALPDGRVYDLGARGLDDTPFRFFLALREPADIPPLVAQLDAVAPGITKILLVPEGRRAAAGAVVVQVSEWTEHSAILRAVGEATGKSAALALGVRAPKGTRLIVEAGTGRVILDTTTIHFDPDEQGFKMLLKIVEANGDAIRRKDLNEQLSKGRGDDATQRQALGRLNKRLKKAGVPTETVKALFRTRKGEISLGISAFVARP